MKSSVERCGGQWTFRPLARVFTELALVKGKGVSGRIEFMEFALELRKNFPFFLHCNKRWSFFARRDSYLRRRTGGGS